MIPSELFSTSARVSTTMIHILLTLSLCLSVHSSKMSFSQYKRLRDPCAYISTTVSD